MAIYFQTWWSMLAKQIMHNILNLIPFAC